MIATTIMGVLKFLTLGLIGAWLVALLILGVWKACGRLWAHRARQHHPR